MDIALNVLSKKTGNHLAVGDIRLRPFNRLVLQQVYADDLQGDTLLYVENLSAGFRLLPLLRSRLEISSVHMDQFMIRVNRADPEAPFNFQFLIDAFSSDEPADTTKSNFSVDIEDIRLTGGILSYDILSEAIRDSVFDFNHIHIRDFEANVSLPSIDLENLDAGISHLSFRERSGVTVENLIASLKSTGKVIRLSNFELSLPRSLARIERAEVDYTGMELNQLAQAAKYSLSVDIPYLFPGDFQTFVPALKNFTDSLTLKSEIAGQLPAIKLDSLSFSYGRSVRLNASASLDDYVYWDTSPLGLQIYLLQINPEGIEQITALTQAGQLPVHTGGVNLKADIEGSLPDLKLDIAATSVPSGTLNVTGTGGYIIKSGDARFDVNVSTNNFDLKTLLGQPELGLATLTLDAAGTMDSSVNIRAKAGLGIDRFDFHGYPYRYIKVEAEYSGKDASLRLLSRDPNAPLLIRGKADLSENQAASLYLRTAYMKPGQLNLMEDKDASLYAVLKAEVEGFDPDKMTAGIKIDSVNLTTGRGSAGLKSIDLNYTAKAGMEKKLNIDSRLLTAALDGFFSVKTIAGSLQNTLAVYFPEFFTPGETHKTSGDRFTFGATIRNTEQLTNSLNLPFSVPDTAHIDLAYAEATDMLNLDVDVLRLQIKEMLLDSTRLTLTSDTARHTLHLAAGTRHLAPGDSMKVQLDVNTYTDSLVAGINFAVQTPAIRTKGELDLAAAFRKSEKSKIPDIFLRILPSTVSFDQQEIKIEPASISIKDNLYEVDNFEIFLSDTEYIKAQGVVSANEQDTLRVALAGIQIGTLMQLLRTDFKLEGEVNGVIVANQLFTSPRLLTDGFSIKDIQLEDQEIGDLNLKSAWSNRIRGLLVHADLERHDAQNSVITGFVLPQRDSIGIRADIRDIRLAWLKPFTDGLLYGLDGSIGARINASGKMKAPRLSGAVSLNNANIGVSMLNVQYHISDSIQIYPDHVSLKNFRIIDERKKEAVINGEIYHTDFSDIRPKATLRLDDFLVLNNPRATDSLFYGTFRINGTVNAEGSDKDLLVKATISNSPESKIFITLPADEASEARMYTSVTFVSKDSIFTMPGYDSIPQPLIAPMPSMPVRLEVAAELTPDLEVGVVINPQTRDMAVVKGGGNVSFQYNMATSDMNLLGDYKVTEGECSISFQGLVKRKFIIAPGGIVKFTGDPMSTSFDVTAIYRLRADLMTLDPIFGQDPYLSRTRVNTECRIRVEGNIDKMNITYAIAFPGVNESVQRKADAIMYTDDIRLKEIAYLLVTGSFYPPASDEMSTPSANSLWTSLASSALTTQLNKLLEGVLSENWSIGTDIHTDDNDASNLEMDVNISTSLFDNRLIISSNIGYQNTTNNLTGDFEVQYKLIRTGELVLKMYNVTNDQYYVQALMTQGVGVVYQREERRFRDLFRRIRKKVVGDSVTSDGEDGSTSEQEDE